MALVAWGDRWCLGGGSAWAVPGPGWCLCALVACALVACVVAWVLGGVVVAWVVVIGGLIGGVWPALVVCPGA